MITKKRGSALKRLGGRTEQVTPRHPFLENPLLLFLLPRWAVGAESRE